MAAASLAVRISAQIAEFQKAFAESTKTLDGFKSDFNTTAKSVQTSVDKMAGDVGKVNKQIESIAKVFGPIGEQIGRTVSTAQSAVSNLGSTFASLGPTVLAAGAGIGILTAGVLAAKVAFDVLQTAAVGAFNFVKSAVQDTVALGDSFFTLSQKTGLAVEDLSALKFVAGQTGTSLDTITAATFKMQTNVGKGGKVVSDAFKGIGLSLKDVQKLDTAGALATTLKHLHDVPGASAQAAAGVAIFGKSFKDIKPLTEEDLPKLIEQAKELGLVMRTETAVAADRLMDALGAAGGGVEGLKLKIGAGLLPTLVTAAEVFGGIFTDAIKTATQSFSGTGKAASSFAVTFLEAANRVLEVVALMTVSLTGWALQTILNFALVGNAVLDMASKMVEAGRLADLITNFGRNKGAFDAIAASINALRTPLNAVTGLAVKMGVSLGAAATGVAETAHAVEGSFADIFAKITADIKKAADEMRAKLKKGVGGLTEGAKEAQSELDKLIDKLKGVTIVAEGKKWEAALKAIGGDFSKLTDKDAKEFLGIVDEITDRFGSLEAAGVGGLKNIAIAMRALTEKGKTLDLAIIPTLSPQTLAAISAKAQPPKMILDIIPQMSDATLATIGVQISKARIDWAARARAFVEDLKNIGLDAAHGLANALAVGIRTGDWSQLENNLKLVLADALGNAAAAAVNLIVPGLGSALAPLFSALADKLLGALGLGTRGRDAVKEFAASMGGFDALRERLRDLGAEGEKLWRSLTQGVGRNSPEEAARAIDAITAALERADRGLKTFTDGAMKRIKAFAASVKGVANETAEAFRKLIAAEMPELEMGIDEANARKALEGFVGTIAGSRGEIEAEFQRLGLFAGTAFAETLREKGLAAALAEAGPLFDELNQLGAEFGLTLEGSAAKFAAFFETAKANQDVVDALEGITLMIQGAGDAAFITQELFSAFSTDAVAQFDKLIARGVSASDALALSQPVLQSLWESQRRYHFETDAATQALIDQGVEQGIVGENMRDVNERILDVLLAIAKVFKADIPAGLDATAQKSKQTADTMARDFDAAGRRAKDSLSGIKVPDIEVKVNYRTGDVEAPEFPDVPRFATGGIVRKPTLGIIGEKGPELVIPLQRLREMAFLDGLRDRYGIPGLQHGGIVRSPTLALIAEAGPEAVIPLSQLGATGPERSQTVILEVDGRALAEVLVPRLPGAVSRLGLGI